MNPTALGSGSRVLNAYPLVHSQGVYEGQREATPDQRVFILTRIGFAGMQRYGAASWSGDISSTWTAMRKQIPAGLGFSISGMPVLDLRHRRLFRAGTLRARAPAARRRSKSGASSTRAGSSSRRSCRSCACTARRRSARCGSSAATAARPTRPMLKFDRLRYRLLPYVYSLAGAVTQQGGTILRPLVMDFLADLRARDDRRPVHVRPGAARQPR